MIIEKTAEIVKLENEILKLLVESSNVAMYNAIVNIFQNVKDLVEYKKMIIELRCTHKIKIMDISKRNLNDLLSKLIKQLLKEIDKTIEEYCKNHIQREELANEEILVSKDSFLKTVEEEVMKYSNIEKLNMIKTEYEKRLSDLGELEASLKEKIKRVRFEKNILVRMLDSISDLDKEA